MLQVEEALEERRNLQRSNLDYELVLDYVIITPKDRVSDLIDLLGRQMGTYRLNGELLNTLSSLKDKRVSELSGPEKNVLNHVVGIRNGELIQMAIDEKVSNIVWSPDFRKAVLRKQARSGKHSICTKKDILSFKLQGIFFAMDRAAEIPAWRRKARRSHRRFFYSQLPSCAFRERNIDK